LKTAQETKAKLLRLLQFSDWHCFHFPAPRTDYRSAEKCWNRSRKM